MTRRTADRLAALAFALLLLAGWSFLLVRPAGTGFGDWQYFHHMWEAGREALLRHGEWPHWDPHHCGGITIWGNPQSQVFSPSFFLSLLVGTAFASKLHTLVHLWLAAFGTYRFARLETRSTTLGALGAGTVFGASGFFAWHFIGGHATFAPFAFTPWLLLAWRRSEGDLRHAVAVAGWMTLTLLEGGVYPFPYFVLLLAFDALLRARAGNLAALLRAGLVAGLLTALLGAVRLLPILGSLSAVPRSTELLQTRSVESLFVSLLDVMPPLGWNDAFGWPEHAGQVGFLGVGLALLGALAGRRRGPYVLGALAFASLTFGDLGPASPWALVHRLPIYDSLRVPSRFLVFVTFFLAVLAGLGLDAVTAAGRSLRPRMRPWLPAALVLALALDLTLSFAPIVRFWNGPRLQGERAERFILVRGEYLAEYATYPRRGVGSRECYEPMFLPPVIGLWSGPALQARVVDADGRSVDPEEARVGEVARTSRTVVFRVEAAAPVTLRVNQRFQPGWRTDVGRIVPRRGLLEVRLPAGGHVVNLRYEAEGADVAAGLGALGLLLAGGLVVWGGRRRIRG